jgi:uncharacterized protein YlxW (UPF0749 family)
LKNGYGSQSASLGEKSIKPDVSYEQRKQLQRAVQQAEKKVQQLESQIAGLEERMAAVDFFTKPDYPEVMRQHGQAQKDLETVMEEWFRAQEALGD